MNGTHITSSSSFNDTLPRKLVQTGDRSHLAESLISPDAVVADPRLDRAEKRKLLASWASDARAVPDAPELRRLENGAVIPIDDILRALKSLDRGEDCSHSRWTRRRPSPSSRIGFPIRLKSTFWRGRSDDDDDDPPPCPAMISGSFGHPLLSEAVIGAALAA